MSVETELLTCEENLVGLMAVNRDVLAQAESLDHVDRIVLDMGRFERWQVFLRADFESGSMRQKNLPICPRHGE